MLCVACCLLCIVLVVHVVWYILGAVYYVSCCLLFVCCVVYVRACVCVCVFQVLGVQDVACWYRWIDSLKLTTLAELDCKEPFNCVSPDRVVSHIRDASSWLYHPKWWPSSDLCGAFIRGITLYRVAQACP